MRLPERLLFAGGREWVCARAEGDVLEVSVGTGRNLPLYAAGVRITGVDVSAAMLEIARVRAAEAGRDADLRVGDAQALEFPDSSFDTVVCTLALCSISDPRAAVAEMKRVLRPGGRVLLLEHIRALNTGGAVAGVIVGRHGSRGNKLTTGRSGDGESHGEPRTRIAVAPARRPGPFLLSTGTPAPGSLALPLPS